MSVRDSFLDSFNLDLTMLSAISLHCGFFLFFDSSSPDLNIVDLLGLVELKCLSVALEQVGVVSHNALVVKLLVTHLEVLDSVLTDLLNATDFELVEDLFGAFLLLALQSLQGFIDLTHVGRLLLVLGELGLLLFFFLELLIAPMLKFSLAIAVEVLLSISHGLLDLLNSSHFFIDLALDLLEDSDSFLVRSALLLDFLEDSSQFVAKVDQVFMHLSNLVKCNDLLSVICDRHDKSKTIALVQKTFNLVPVAKETHHLLQRCESDISEEVLALLQDSDSQSLLNLS